MGYVNQSYGYDQKKARRKGKLFGTIDFEVSETISAKYFENDDAPVVGKLHIGGKTFDVTFQELDQIARTMNNSKDVVMRKYKMGMMN